MNQEITLSVIVTFYNQAEFVHTALDSVASRCSKTVEIIAVDDCSTDGTGDAILEYGGSVRPILLSENRGVSLARNMGVSEAQGEYVVFLDGDDALAPWAFDVYRAVIHAKRPVLIVAPLLWFEGDVPHLSLLPDTARFIEYRDYFSKDRSVGAVGARVFERRSFEQVGGFDSDTQPHEDHDLVWRLGIAGPVVQILDPVTIYHRAHAGQITRQATYMFEGLRKLLEKERLGRYPGGRRRVLERRACIAGCVVHWAIRLRRSSYAEATWLTLACSGSIAAAVIVRLRALLKGRRPTQTIPIPALPDI